jgi:hypothetical protein
MPPNVPNGRTSGIKKELEVPTSADNCAPLTTSVYEPKILSTMRVAFGAACEALPNKVVDTEKARQNLARRIMIHMDRGEYDSDRLAKLAVRDVERRAMRDGTSSE